MDPFDIEGFRERVRWLVDARFGGTATKLVEAAGLKSKSHVRMITSGLVGDGVSADVVDRIAKAGGVRFDWLWSGAEPRDRPVEQEGMAGLPADQIAAIQWAFAAGSKPDVIDTLRRPRKANWSADQWIDYARVLRAGGAPDTAGEVVRPDELPVPPRAARTKK